MNIKSIISIVFILCSIQVSAAVKKINTATSDIGVINKEQILYWLEKRGEIVKNATEEQKKQAIKKYLGNKSFKPRKLPGKFGQKVMLAEQKAIDSVNHKSNPKSLRASVLKSAKQVTSQVKVLAILIDYQDLKHDDNGLTSSDTAMYYSAYPSEHYQGLLFSDTGYEGPSGQNLQSAYQYYQQESGQGLAFTGGVQGWFTADNDAAYYGGNDENDDDKNPSALVLEAVTKAVAAGLDLSEYDHSDFFDLDGDGNINEPDGIIDHVMIFHASMGEETGGGPLGADAIWSHRGFVVDDNNGATAVPGSDIKLFGYTITPIDAAVGVVVHEFGHDLGVRDEYDTENGTFGSPVADWSLMASGSWVGSPSGTQPSGFSPYVKDIYQNKYQGNWINQQELELIDLETTSVDLVTATNHQNGINQVKVNLPNQKINFGAPYTGDNQYYSNAGDMMNNTMSFDVVLPAGSSTLTMKARWDIEVDYDYVQVMVNDVVIAGNHTKATNPLAGYESIVNFITDKSISIEGAEGDLGWVDLTFDLSAYENQTVTIKFSYVTDQAVGGYGFAADNIRVTNNDSDIVFIGGETENEVTLNGFMRMASTLEGKSHSYYLQLRSYTETDSALAGSKYEPGLLVWYRNDAFTNNQVNSHPGQGFIGVVDADQAPIKSGAGFAGTSRQIRDAALSLFDQGVFGGDTNQTAISKFDDRLDYSSPFQPASGLILPKLGLNIEVKDQATDSTTANVELTRLDVSAINAMNSGLTTTLSVEDIMMSSGSTFNWDMGDGTNLTGSDVSHTYAQAGRYTVTVDYQTTQGDKTLTLDLVVGDAIEGTISIEQDETNITVTSAISGGFGDFVYRWNFGDGSDVEESATSTASHTYEQAGEYTITLTVSDETSQTFTVTETITVVKNLAITFTKATNNLIVIFTATPTGGDGNYTYSWDFGDGSSSTEKNPTHTYGSAGSYTVVLSVTDGNGITAEQTSTFTVSSPVVVPTKTTTKTSSSSGGGSMNFTLLLLVLSLVTRRVLKLSKD